MSSAELLAAEGKDIFLLFDTLVEEICPNFRVLCQTSKDPDRMNESIDSVDSFQSKPYLFAREPKDIASEGRLGGIGKSADASMWAGWWE